MVAGGRESGGSRAEVCSAEGGGRSAAVDPGIGQMRMKCWDERGMNSSGSRIEVRVARGGREGQSSGSRSDVCRAT